MHTIKNENDGVGEPCIPRRVLISDVRAVFFYDLIGIQFDDSDLLAAQSLDTGRATITVSGAAKWRPLHCVVRSHLRSRVLFV